MHCWKMFVFAILENRQESCWQEKEKMAVEICKDETRFEKRCQLLITPSSGQRFRHDSTNQQSIGREWRVWSGIISRLIDWKGGWRGHQGRGSSIRPYISENDWPHGDEGSSCHLRPFPVLLLDKPLVKADPSSTDYPKRWDFFFPFEIWVDGHTFLSGDITK